MSATYDVVILGAGIVGAACALECARAGMTVAVIEKNAVASGATGAAMGHVVIMDDSPAQFALTKYSQSLWSALAAGTAILRRIPSPRNHLDCRRRRRNGRGPAKIR